jgi:hypothetical protein
VAPDQSRRNRTKEKDNFMEMIMFFMLIALIGFAMFSLPYNGGTVHRERGAVTVTYEAPLSVQGTTVGPTTAQIGNIVNKVSANIIKTADGDVAATVTHNLGSNTAQLALGNPMVILEPLLSQALTALSAWTITTKTAVVVTLTALGSTGSGNAAPQLRVHVLRPSSNSQ